MIVNLTLLELYGEAFYSGQSYNDSIFVKTESYELIKGKIPEKICLGELDGKHSCVYGSVCAYNYTEPDLVKMELDLDRDGDNLAEELNLLYGGFDLDFDEEQKEIEEYLNSIDSYVTINLTVRKSNVDKVRELIKDL